jgi:hypothetical protein
MFLFINLLFFAFYTLICPAKITIPDVDDNQYRTDSFTLKRTQGYARKGDFSGNYLLTHFN